MTPELFTAQKIAKFAFGAVVETSVGKLTAGAIAHTNFRKDCYTILSGRKPSFVST